MVGKLMRPGNKSWIDTVNYGTDDSIFEDSTDVYETSLKELVHIKELDFDL
jgi:hypothetical protein